jgi:glycosyltransferase involved in cell wall biosynthesis
MDELRATVSREAARDMLGIERDRFLFLNVGVVAPHKGQAALVFAFATLAHHHPDASLAILGDAESEYGQALRHSIDRLGLAARIRLEPTVMDPLPWYRAADAFVLASDSETLPRTLLEAMAFELPVAGTSIAGIPELVVHGRNGLLFPPRDLGALVEVLRKLLGLSPEERAVLGAAAARDVRARQQPAAELEAFQALISTLSGRSVS